MAHMQVKMYIFLCFRSWCVLQRSWGSYKPSKHKKPRKAKQPNPKNSTNAGLSALPLYKVKLWFFTIISILLFKCVSVVAELTQNNSSVKYANLWLWKHFFKKNYSLTILNIEFPVGIYTWKLKNCWQMHFVCMYLYQNYCLGEFFVCFYLMIQQYLEYSVLDAFYVYLLKINDFFLCACTSAYEAKNNLDFITACYCVG